MSSTPWARVFSPVSAACWRCCVRTPIRFSTTRCCGFGVLQLGKAVSLRLLSWLAYGLGAVVMVAQAASLAPKGRRDQAMVLAALLAFCSPYPVRFAVEGKSYAFLVLLVALGWWWRRRRWLPGYGLAVVAAAFTHFYGLFVFAAAVGWDGWRRRWGLMATAAFALLPALAWIGYASAYLLSSRSGSWIGTPDFALLEETLARALGPWPLPKLGLLLLVWAAVRRWGLDPAGLDGLATGRVLDASGVIPTALMVVGVVGLSFAKPMAFSRYFVVLLPALIPWLAVEGARVTLNRRGQVTALAAIALLLALWWQQAFLGVGHQLGGGRESDNFRAISQLTSGATARYAPRPRLLNLSDRMELAAWRLPAPVVPWQGADGLQRHLQAGPPSPDQTSVLAASGPEAIIRRRLTSMQQQGETELQCSSADPLLTAVLRTESSDRPTGLLLVVEPGFNSARALEEARLLISQMSSVQAVGVVLIGTPLPEELSSSVVG